MSIVHSLPKVRVRDCMHVGILSCTTDAPLIEVAAIMAKHHVHAVAVKNGSGGRPIGVVSALDVIAALSADGDDLTAAQAAATETVTVSSDAPLQEAVQLMTEHAVSHLVVLEAASGFPVGILSTLDVAAVFAGRIEG
jgi:CBS domain-containing protein